MKLLILGGTRFLGRHIAEAALAAGHTVSLFNRGTTNPDLFPQAEHLVGDRDGGLEALEGRTFDAVIDTCGYVPRIVAQSARLLAGRVGRYVFISTISVYGSTREVGMDESYPTAVLPEPSEEVGKYYGELKALCEQEVTAALGDGAVIIRPGLIVGPEDPTDRFTYWPWRLAQGGEVLAPGRPGRTVQFIDARDLAAWTLLMAGDGEPGIYNANGPAHPVPMSEVLESCRLAGAADARLTWVPDDFLVEREVGMWVEMPLWIPENDPEHAGFFAIDCSKAIAAGLTFRSLDQTVRDTGTWAAARPAGHEWKAGMSLPRERELLDAYAASAGRAER